MGIGDLGPSSRPATWLGLFNPKLAASEAIINIHCAGHWPRGPFVGRAGRASPKTESAATLPRGADRVVANAVDRTRGSFEINMAGRARMVEVSEMRSAEPGASIFVDDTHQSPTPRGTARPGRPLPAGN